MDSFALRLIKIRNASSLSQSAIAKGIGVAASQYQLYEYGRNSPSVKVLFALSELYNVPLDFFNSKGIYAHWDWLLEHKEAVIAAIDPLSKDVSDLQYLQLVVPTIVDLRQFERGGEKKVRLLVRPPKEELDVYDFPET